MKLIINGDSEIVNGDKLTVSELLVIKNVDMPDMVSVQLNGEFVDRDNFSDQTVKEGDEVDFLYFMGGGSVRCQDSQLR